LSEEEQLSFDPFDRLEYAPAFCPVEFFTLTATLHYTKQAPTLRTLRRFLLSDTSDLLGDEKFADVALAWNEEGIHAALFVQKPIERVEFPNFDKGDALELFFDTRNLKTAYCATRFCHHFLFFPEGEKPAREITHFRTEDTHPLCDPSELILETKQERKAYSMQIFIPASCLHGFDPKSGNSLGFTYCIHRPAAPPQHFSVSSQHFSIDQSPRLWATLVLEE